MNNAVQMNMHKPFLPMPKITHRYELVYKWLGAINWLWWIIRIPMALIAATAAYGVTQFAGEYLVSPWNVLAGWSFESAYLGAIALADQQLDDETKILRIGTVEILTYNPTAVLWYLVNFVAVIASILSNLLFFNGGTYVATTAETLTHAVPLPLLGFFYGLLVHRYTHSLALVHRKEFQEFPFRCECGAKYKSQKMLNGHKAHCKAAKVKQITSKP
jgi:hypothetical protein